MSSVDAAREAVEKRIPLEVRAWGLIRMELDALIAVVRAEGEAENTRLWLEVLRLQSALSYWLAWAKQTDFDFDEDERNMYTVAKELADRSRSSVPGAKGDQAGTGLNEIPAGVHWQIIETVESTKEDAQRLLLAASQPKEAGK